jgi:hypothetical protein
MTLPPLPSVDSTLTGICALWVPRSMRVPIHIDNRSQRFRCAFPKYGLALKHDLLRKDGLRISAADLPALPSGLKNGDGVGDHTRDRTRRRQESAAARVPGHGRSHMPVLLTVFTCQWRSQTQPLHR